MFSDFGCRIDGGGTAEGGRRKRGGATRLARLRRVLESCVVDEEGEANLSAEGFFIFSVHPFRILMAPAQRRYTPTKLEQRTCTRDWLPLLF